MNNFLIGIIGNLPEEVKSILIKIIFFLGRVLSFRIFGGLSIRTVSSLLCLVIAIIILTNPQRRQQRPFTAAICLGWAIGSLAPQVYDLWVGR